MKYRLNAVCIIEKDDKILLGRKAPEVGPYPGKWLIPGGGINPETESLDEAMAREVFEETHLVVTKFERMFFNEDVAQKNGEETRLIFLYYKITDVADWSVAQAGDDLVEIAWFAHKELSKIPIPPVSERLYKQFGWI
jgi:ADP-ribose pyrophosphatase YjhB (NUDIX family)